MPLNYEYGSDTFVTRRKPNDSIFPKPGSHRRDQLDFRQTYPDIRSAILAISLHGKDLVGVELGVYSGDSFVVMLQVCQNIKKLYGIDLWEPYKDRIGGESNPKVVNRFQTEYLYNLCVNYVAHSGESERAEIWQMDSVKAADEFENDSVDFVFFDAHLDQKQLEDELHAWYPKIREGGLVIGHDFYTTATQNAVSNFIESNKLQVMMASYDNTFIWIK